MSKERNGPTSRDLRILIVGAGPVGLTAAIELKRRGFTPTIIDMAAGPAGESRAFGIHARTLEIFEASGIARVLLERGNRVDASSFHDQDGEFMRIDFSHARQKYSFALMLPQSQTEQILIDHLQQTGVHVRWETALNGLEPAKKDAVVCSYGEKRESFDMVVGCDGAHSTVRKTLGIGFAGKAYQREWQLADVVFVNDRPLNEIRIKTIGTDVLVYFPLAEGLGRFVYTGDKGIKELINREVALQKIDWMSNFRISHRIVESYQCGNIFLAGDAAHIHSPVGGRGMNLGIEDAATLAWLVETGQTEKYNSMRLRLGKSVLRFTNRQTRQITSSNPLIRFVNRRIAPLMMRSRSLQRMAFRTLSGSNTPRPAFLD